MQKERSMMTSPFYVHTFCFIAVVCVLVIQDVGACTFPDFLSGKKHEHWLYKVWLNEDKSEIKAYSLSVTGSVINFAPYYPSNSQNPFFQWTCLSRLDTDSYFIEISGGQPTHYKCIDFIHLSSEVKRLKKSPDIMYNNEVACDGTERQWDPWLLVRGGSSPFQTVPCSLIGGFNIQITDTNGRMCNKLHLVPRLEIGCFESDKMYFNFQDCPHERFTHLMGRKQVLHCIAEWSDDTHRYLVTRSPGKDNYWLLKLPWRSSEMNYFAATLSSDLVVDSDNSHSVALQLVRKVVTNICSDAADDCADVNTNRNELCAGMYGAIYCKRTCRLCHEDDDQTCTIDRNAIGKWEFVKDDISTKTLVSPKFSVREHKFLTKPLLDTTCLTHEGESGYHEYIMVKYQTNGCYPRFTCISSHVVNRVMFYKESRGATWPQYEEDYFCSARTYDFLPPTPTWKVAVKERSSLSPVLCNIPMDLYDFETRTDYFFCNGRLQTSSCTALKSTGFSIMYNQSDTCDLADIHFDCISSKIYEEPGDKRVAILARDTENVYYCFIFDINYTGATQIPANECHEEFIFWDHNELQYYNLAPSDGICIERKAVAHSSAVSQMTFIQITIPILLSMLYFTCLS